MAANSRFFPVVCHFSWNTLHLNSLSTAITSQLKWRLQVNWGSNLKLDWIDYRIRLQFQFEFPDRQLIATVEWTEPNVWNRIEIVFCAQRVWFLLSWIAVIVVQFGSSSLSDVDFMYISLFRWLLLMGNYSNVIHCTELMRFCRFVAFV